MAAFLAFMLLLLDIPLALGASFTVSVLATKEVTPSSPVASVSVSLDNINLAYGDVVKDVKPNPLTDGTVCTRNAGCALNAAKRDCGRPPYKHRPACFKKGPKPSATLCCGKTHGKDHPCTIFWPESHAECAEEMKNHDCHCAFGTYELCEPIKTHEPPDQCALKAHCAARKDCSKWYQRKFLNRCAKKPDHKSCCLPLGDSRLPARTNLDYPFCKGNWLKDLNDCGKGCKVGQGGQVTCQDEKRDTALMKNRLLPSMLTSNPNITVATTEIAKESPEARKHPRTTNPSKALGSTARKRDDRGWVKGDPIPPVTDCRRGVQCALASWKAACDSWHQKISPGCWNRAPGYHTCCNARGERKPPQNDACKVRWPTNEAWCQETLKAWDCKDDPEGNLVCKKRPGIEPITGN